MNRRWKCLTTSLLPLFLLSVDVTNGSAVADVEGVRIINKRDCSKDEVPRTTGPNSVAIGRRAVQGGSVCDSGMMDVVIKTAGIERFFLSLNMPFFAEA